MGQWSWLIAKKIKKLGGTSWDHLMNRRGEYFAKWFLLMDTIVIYKWTWFTCMGHYEIIMMIWKNHFALKIWASPPTFLPTMIHPKLRTILLNNFLCNGYYYNLQMDMIYMHVSLWDHHDQNVCSLDKTISLKLCFSSTCSTHNKMKLIILLLATTIIAKFAKTFSHPTYKQIVKGIKQKKKKNIKKYSSY